MSLIDKFNLWLGQTFPDTFKELATPATEPRTCSQCQQVFTDSEQYPPATAACVECLKYPVIVDKEALEEEYFVDPTEVRLINAIPQIPDHDGQRVFVGVNIGRLEQLYLDTAQRNRHLYLLGKTRTGKTTLLQNIARQDFRLGHGVGFIDPHGDAVDELLAHIPEDRLDDVIWFDPTSQGCPPFNLLALPYAPHKLAADTVSAFKLFFADSWGPQLEMILLNSLSTLLADREPHSFADLRRLLVDETYRDELAGRSPSEQLRSFWSGQFPTLSKTAVNPVLNKLNAFLSPLSPLERLFSQRENALDFTDIMNGGKIFLVKLAKGELGDEPSRLLGGLIVTALSQAALGRVGQANRPDFFLTVDEFQNYTVASFETIMAEAAKYRLNLTLANQTLSQLSPSLRHAIIGNVGTLIVFQCSADDAAHMAREMRSSIVLLRPKRHEGLTRMNELWKKANGRPMYQEEETFLLRGAEDRAYSLPQAALVLHAHFADDAKELVEATRDFPDGTTRCSARHKDRARFLLTYAERFREDPTIGLQEYFEPESNPYPELHDFTNLTPGIGVIRLLNNDQVYPMMFWPPAEGDPEVRETLLARTAAPPATPPRETPQQAEEEAQKPPMPKTEDDFTF